MPYSEDQDAREKLTAAFTGLALGLAFVGIVAVIAFMLALNAH